MAFAYIPSSANVSGAATAFANGLRQDEAQQQQSDDLEQKRQDAKDAVMYQQFASLAPDQKANLYAQLPDRLRAWVMNPNAIPPHVRDALEQSQYDATLAANKEKTATSTLNGNVATRTNNVLNGTPDTKGGWNPDSSFINNAGYAITTGKNAPESTAKMWNDLRVLGEDGTKKAYTAEEINKPQSTANENNAKAYLAGEQGKVVAPNSAAERSLKYAQANKANTEATTAAATAAGGVAGLDPADLARQLVTLKADPAAIAGMLRSRVPGVAQTAAQALAMAPKMDPNFSWSNYGVRKKAADSMVNDPLVVSANRLLQHARSGLDTVTTLDNTNYPLLNRGINTIAPALGDTTTQNALADYIPNMAAVATEFAKNARGAGAVGEKEIQTYIHELDPNAAPGAQRHAITKLVELSGAQIAEAARKYYELTGGYGDFRKIISPENITMLKQDFPAVYNKLRKEVPYAVKAAEEGTPGITSGITYPNGTPAPGNPPGYMPGANTPTSPAGSKLKPIPGTNGFVYQ